MEKVVPSSLLIKPALIILVATLFGCAHSAPDLPPDYGSANSTLRLDESNFSNEELSLNCIEIDNQISELRNQQAAIKSQIVASRETDQTVGYFSSVLFPPLWLAVDNDEDFKALYDRVGERADTLLQLSRLKSCKKSDRGQSFESQFEKELRELLDLREKGVISADEFLELRSRVFDKYYPGIRRD